MRQSIPLLHLRTLQTCLFLSVQCDYYSVIFLVGGRMTIAPTNVGAMVKDGIRKTLNLCVCADSSTDTRTFFFRCHMIPEYAQ